MEYDITQSELYECNYGYRSGINGMMRAHLRAYYDEIISKIELIPGDIVVDIGSNDATLLHNYSSNYIRLGIDPTGNQFREYYGDVLLNPTYFTAAAFWAICPGQKARVVSSISMFYDLPDPVQFARDIYDILADDGLWTCEQSYIKSMLDTNSFDTICHEHLEYYAVKQIKWIADEVGFFVENITFNDCNGGSFRVYFRKYSCPDVTKELIEAETRAGLDSPYTYSKFIQNCNKEMKDLKVLIRNIVSNGQRVYIYGASTKGNCTLQYAGIGSDFVPYAVERNAQKVGLCTSTGIPIISEESMREDPPHFLLVLPWHFREDIIKREAAYVEHGGQFIFPLPHLDIYGLPRIMITGCDGMIAQYVKKEFQHQCLYGITREEHPFKKCSNITKFSLDMKYKDHLETIIKMVKPSLIIHLASMSNSRECFNNPIDTLFNNGMIAVYIADIIHRNKLNTKLFNAVSSEMYKNHTRHIVTDDDATYGHIHPYSIAKMMSHNMIKFYRDTYNLPFYNGILFTVESARRSNKFLFKKISEHARRFLNDREPLALGNLDSYRNIIHASDVARGIKMMCEYGAPGDYVICGDSHHVRELVMRLYGRYGITAEDNPFTINEALNNESEPTYIDGDAKKLRELGWFPQVSIDEILEEYYCS
jgi:GDP-mannose 4,6-dehydratase